MITSHCCCQVAYHYIILSDYAAKHLNLTHHNVLIALVGLIPYLKSNSSSQSKVVETKHSKVAENGKTQVKHKYLKILLKYGSLVNVFTFHHLCLLV